MKLKTIIIAVTVLFLVIPNLGLAKGDRVTEAFGMNIHLRQRIQDSDWETAMRAAEAAGVEWGREQFNWDVIEPSDDDYSWDTYDAVVDKYEEHNIKMLGLLTYSSAWASSNPDSSDYEFYYPDLDAWEDYVGKVAEHYAGRVDYWEIWNEPNHASFWKSDVQQYSTHFAIAVDAIKTANPDAKVVLGGLSGADADWLDDLYNQLNDKSDIDIVAIHPYRLVGEDFNYTPEQTTDSLNSLPVDIYNIKAVINRHDQKNTPIWLTEVGWTTYEDGVTKKMQAEYLMRLYTIALSIPDVKKVFWYALNDTSSNTTYLDAHFGILDEEYAPKKAAEAYDFTKNNLDNKYFKDQTLPKYRIIDNFIHNNGWHFEGTKCANGTINATYHSKMKVSYDFDGADNCYAPIVLNKELPTSTKSIQFKAKGDNDDTYLRVRLTDATGEVFQYNFGYLPKEWLFYNMQTSEYSSRWGGDDDGVLDKPFTFNAFVLDDTDGSKANGTVYFDELYSSGKGGTYLYRYHGDHKDMYAYWSTKKSRSINIELTGAGKVRVKRWNKKNILKQSGNAIYKINANKSIKFLQTL